MSLIHTVARYQRTRRRGLDRCLWPLAVRAVRDDLLVVGESMLAMARSAGTPCTRVVEVDGAADDAAAVESDRPVAPPRRFCAMVVAAVELVVPSADGRDGDGGGDGVDIWLDAELDGCEPVAESIRLLGRHSSGAPRVFSVRPSPRGGELRAMLPSDIRPGDLLAFVVMRPVALHDIRRRSRHWERLL